LKILYSLFVIRYWLLANRWIGLIAGNCEPGTGNIFSPLLLGFVRKVGDWSPGRSKMKNLENGEEIFFGRTLSEIPPNPPLQRGAGGISG
jgi:hypothetical protein